MPTIAAIRAAMNRGRSYSDLKDAVDVPTVPAITSAVAVGAPTKAEYDLLRADVVALRTQVVTLQTALETSGYVL
jgi:hypothetical protein